MEELTLSETILRGRRGIKWHHFPEDVVPAWVADMDFPVAEPVRRAVHRLVDQGDFGYFWRDAEDSIERAFAERMRARYSWPVDTDRVQQVTDLIQAVTALLFAFTEAGDGVVLQTPIYHPFLRVIDATGRRVVANPLRDDGTRYVLDAEALERVVDETTRILLVCNPHNPSGRVFERGELEAIGRVAVERDLIIVCDEIHADLVYPGHQHIPIAALSEEVAARTVTITSATKGFNIAGLRCGVMHFGSAELHARFSQAIPSMLLGHVSSFGIDATVAAWREGQPWLDGVLRQLEANRDRVAAWASEVPGLHHYRPEGTYLAWLDFRGFDLPGSCAQEFFQEQGRVGLSPGQDFDPENGHHCVRLNFATSPEILERLLGQMDQALQRVAG